MKLINHQTGNTLDVADVNAGKALAAAQKTSHFSVVDDNGKTVYRELDTQDVTPEHGSTEAELEQLRNDLGRAQAAMNAAVEGCNSNVANAITEFKSAFASLEARVEALEDAPAKRK